MILAHYGKLKNNQSTTCFSTVLNSALFDKNSLADGAKYLTNISLWRIMDHDNIINKQALNVTLLLAKYHIFSTSSCDGELSIESVLLHPQNHLESLNKFTQLKTNQVNFYLNTAVCCNPLFRSFPNNSVWSPY